MRNVLTKTGLALALAAGALAACPKVTKADDNEVSYPSWQTPIDADAPVVDEADDYEVSYQLGGRGLTVPATPKNTRSTRSSGTQARSQRLRGAPAAPKRKYHWEHGWVYLGKKWVQKLDGYVWDGYGGLKPIYIWVEEPQWVKQAVKVYD